MERRVDAELREQVEHAGGRAQRVGVGLLVHGDGHPALAARAPAHGVEVGAGRPHSVSSAPSTWISGGSLPRTSSSRFKSFSMCSALSSVPS